MDDRIQQLASFDVNAVINPSDPYYSYNDVADKLQLLKNSAQAAVENPTFWKELPEATKSNIVSWVDGLLSTLNQIVDNRKDGTWLSQNYPTTQNQIIGYYDSLYPPFVVGVREFKNADGMTKQELSATLKRVRTAAKEVEKKAKTVDDLTS